MAPDFLFISHTMYIKQRENTGLFLENDLRLSSDNFVAWTKNDSLSLSLTLFWVNVSQLVLYYYRLMPLQCSCLEVGQGRRQEGLKMWVHLHQVYLSF